MPDSSPGPISFDQFRRMLAELLVIEEEKITPEASFTEDIYVDSLRWAEMALRIEQLGVAMPSDAFWDIQTVGDAYQCYLSLFGAGA